MCHHGQPTSTSLWPSLVKALEPSDVDLPPQKCRSADCPILINMVPSSYARTERSHLQVCVRVASKQRLQAGTLQALRSCIATLHVRPCHSISMPWTSRSGLCLVTLEQLDSGTASGQLLESLQGLGKLGEAGTRGAGLQRLTACFSKAAGCNLGRGHTAFKGLRNPRAAAAIC